MSSSKLDANQTLQGAYDDASTSFKMTPLNSLVPSGYDYVAITYPSASSELYTFKSGGSSGTSVGTITLVYTDSTKANLSSVTRA